MILIRALYLSEHFLKMLKDKEPKAHVHSGLATGLRNHQFTENKKAHRHLKPNSMPSPALNEVHFYE